MSIIPFFKYYNDGESKSFFIPNHCGPSLNYFSVFYFFKWCTWIIHTFSMSFRFLPRYNNMTNRCFSVYACVIRVKKKLGIKSRLMWLTRIIIITVVDNIQVRYIVSIIQWRRDERGWRVISIYDDLLVFLSDILVNHTRTSRGGACRTRNEIGLARTRDDS